MKPKIICIIPARGGSKGVPRKNIRPMCGKPLIAWTVEQARKSQHLSRVVVSTDDQEIAEVSRRYGAEVPFLRPDELARDNSPTYDAILHALNWFEERGETFDMIVLLEPTSPLRKDDDIDNAIQLFIDNYANAGSLVSLGEVGLENPFIMKKIEAKFVTPLMETTGTIFQRQQLPKVYFPYGVIYLSKVDTLKATRTFYQKNTIPYFIERWQNYEIDDLVDFITNEAILKARIEGGLQ